MIGVVREVVDTFVDFFGRLVGGESSRVSGIAVAFSTFSRGWLVQVMGCLVALGGEMVVGRVLLKKQSVDCA